MAWCWIMTKSEKARATTSMLEGVRRLLVLEKHGLIVFCPLGALDISSVCSSLEEDVENHAVAQGADDPQDEESDGQDVLVEGVDGGKGQPVRVGVVHNVLRRIEPVVGTYSDIFCL